MMTIIMRTELLTMSLPMKRIKLIGQCMPKIHNIQAASLGLPKPPVFGKSQRAKGHKSKTPTVSRRGFSLECMPHHATNVSSPATAECITLGGSKATTCRIGRGSTKPSCLGRALGFRHHNSLRAAPLSTARNPTNANHRCNPQPPKKSHSHILIRGGTPEGGWGCFTLPSFSFSARQPSRRCSPAVSARLYPQSDALGASAYPKPPTHQSLF